VKIVAINGSPRGKNSNTNVMVSAFLKGAKEAGAETINIFLAEKDIKYCRGCYCCWIKTPGKCAIDDDMLGVLSMLAGANVIVLATPVYFNNISGTLKVFMDRLAVTGNPLSKKDAKKENNVPSSPQATTKLMIMSNCGSSNKSQFEVVSSWIKKVTSLMRTDLIGEIYAAQGKNLSSTSEELRPAINKYLQLLENAGKEVAVELKLSKETEKLLEQGFI